MASNSSKTPPSLSKSKNSDDWLVNKDMAKII